MAVEAFQPFSAAPNTSADAYFAKELGAKVREASRSAGRPRIPARSRPARASTPGASPRICRPMASWWRATPRLPTTANRPRRCRPWRAAPKAVPSGACCAAMSTISACACAASTASKSTCRSRCSTSSSSPANWKCSCSLPEFWRKVSIIYSGGDDFAVYGSWDALIALAREVQRLFHRFTEENLKEYPGAEGKTISMAIALAPETYYPLASVYEEAGRNLDLAKVGRQGLHLPAGPHSGMASSERRRRTEGYGHAPDPRFPHVAAVPVSVAEFLPPRGYGEGGLARRSAPGASSGVSIAF